MSHKQNNSADIKTLQTKKTKIVSNVNQQKNLNVKLKLLHKNMAFPECSTSKYNIESEDEDDFQALCPILKEKFQELPPELQEFLQTLIMDINRFIANYEKNLIEALVQVQITQSIKFHKLSQDLKKWEKFMVNVEPFAKRYNKLKARRKHKK